MWSLFPRGRANNKEAKRDSSAWVLFNDLQAQIVEESPATCGWKSYATSYEISSQEDESQVYPVLTYFFE
jgi:hypothetical protein